MRRIIIAAAALLALAAGASASEINIGVQAGYGWSQSDVTIPEYPAQFELDSEGWIAGGFAGVDWDVAPSLSLGVEADVNWTGADGGSPSGLVGELYVVQQNWNASFRGRASFDVAPNTEVYGAAGLAWTDVDVKYEPLAGGVDNATLHGWTAGLGVERRYDTTWFSRVEYRYSKFDDEYFFHNGPSTFDLTTHAILLAIGLIY